MFVFLTITLSSTERGESAVTLTKREEKGQQITFFFLRLRRNGKKEGGEEGKGYSRREGKKGSLPQPNLINCV